MTEEKMILGKKMNIALHYTADNLLKTGNNPKPVLLHSFRVANILYENGYEENVVISGILHDLIEDTDVSYNDIKNEFGEDIANIVQAVSFDKNIQDKYEQAKALFNNCLKQGKEALLVKCADLIENIDYVQFVPKMRKELLKKYNLFLEISKKIIGKEKIYKKLEKKYIEIGNII